MCGFFNVPQNCEHSRVVRRGQHFLLSYFFKTLSAGPARVELTTSRRANRCSTNWATGPALWMLIVCKKKLRRICQLITVSCKIAATSQIRELESLCIRQRAILNWPSGNRSFALTAPTSTSTGFLRSTQFISHPTEWTVHKEGAPRRLITESIPTIWKPSVESTTSAISARSRRLVSKQTLDLSETVRGIFS